MRRITWTWLLPVALFLLLPAAASAQGALSAALTGHRALRRGDQGPAVATLQTLLRTRGFDPVKIDGVFGPLTEAAVREAQQAYGLTEDGVAGARTALALEAGEAPSAVAVAAPAPDPAPAAAADPAVKTDTAVDQVSTEGPAQPTSTLVVHQVSAAPAPAVSETLPAPAAATAQFALTFNGAPDPGLLPGILSSLKQYGMHATFFITGKAAQEQPDLVAQIVAAGHEVADGGWSNDAMAALSPRDAKLQLQKAQTAITKAAGRAPVYFRPPQGALSQPLADASVVLGLQSVLWTNVGVADDPAADPADLTRRLAEAVYPGSILMLHQDRQVTAGLLNDLLKGLAERGAQSVTLSELFHS